MTETRTHLLFLIPSLRGGGAERVIVTLLRHMNRSLFRLGLAVVDMREAVYRDDVPEDVEFIDLGCTRVRYALPKIMRLIWRRRPDVVFSTLGHLIWRWRCFVLCCQTGCATSAERLVSSARL